jgi:hypothetical protein
MKIIILHSTFMNKAKKKEHNINFFTNNAFMNFMSTCYNKFTILENVHTLEGINLHLPNMTI